MAEVTAMRNNALPYPIYGAPWTVLFPLLDADGDPIAPSSPDSEISKNGDTAADCTNEAVEIVNGSCYLILTGTELTCDAALIQVKSTGAKTTVITLYPRKLVTIRSNTSASGGSDTDGIVLDAGASAVDDFYNGMVVIATIDSNVEVRVISDYNGSTKKASVVPDFNVAPDNTDTFVIKLPEGVQLNQANVTHAAEVAWASGAITSSVIATGAIDADAIADNAIDAGAIAADAITAAKLAADVTTELQNGLATAAALSTVDTVVDAIQAKTDNLPSDPADASVVAGLIAALEGKVDTVDTNVSAILADTGTDGVVVAAGSKTGYTLSATGSAALTEGYAALGAAGTLPQILYEMRALLAEKVISSTTLTTKKLDGSTTAATYTLDDDTTPSAITRAS